VRKRLSFVFVGAALMMVAPLGLGGGGSAQAMTCAADPPADTGCKVVFGVLGLVCNGTPPKLPIGLAAAVPSPLVCPPLG
jgi:hypothetical protein